MFRILNIIVMRLENYTIILVWRYFMVNAFSERLRELRQESGFTSDQLAHKIGVTKSTISFWENGINEPKASYIVALSKIFNVSSDYLLGLKETI